MQWWRKLQLKGTSGHYNILITKPLPKIDRINQMLLKKLQPKATKIR